MSGALAAAIPVKQASPYPRRGSCRTRAPAFSAISGVPSVELLSTTSTSVTRLAERSARTRPIACASLCVGMMTETRTELGLEQPPRSVGPALCQPGVDAPRSPSASYCEPKRGEDRNQQFPDPCRAPLRHPKAAKIQERDKSDWA